ncbi:iron-containing redox enzyme family protein [Mycobacterium sp. E2479]|uniref:iron-containing redox enzyme family protein n=1 Tax=Mycobacterium sp. E2479 TaxID=1834134 RepID=UPI0007FBA993|nr:iron-containing redox enzyme family protein [Mycobacterium sp. E2479]OBH62487.1 hypothetical protein A5686_19310 [Mycobacterium sp. E2479]
MTAAEVKSFLEQLNSEIRREKASMLDAGILNDIEAGMASREQIGAWAKVFYAATRNGRFILGNFYANSPDDPVVRRELAENLFEEETGRISGVNKCHMDVFLDFLQAFDVNPQQASELSAPVGQETPQGRVIAPEDFYVELTAYGLSVEVPNAEYCQRIYQALKKNYGFSDHELTWFSMHAALDADHGEEFSQYAAKAAASPSGLERLREQTLALSDVVRQVWDGFGRWRESPN